MSAPWGFLARVGSMTLGTAHAATAAAGGYLGVVTLAGLRRPAAPAPTNRHHFTILVPAHDEELVIARTLRSFERLDYPRDRFTVHVVADNCTDRTAEIVTASPWQVHVRDAPDQPGKSRALNWLLGRLDAEQLDLVVVVDADTVVDPDMLHQFDAAFTDGVDVVQGRYRVLDAGANSAAALRSAAMAARHHLRPLGRVRLGGSCGLFGNGMAFRSEVLARHPWRDHLVEDAELQLRLLLDGTRVAYAPHARVEAEMPSSLAASTTQHQRWELGRSQLAREFLPRLVTGLRRPGQRIAKVDAIVDLMLPPMSLLVAVQLAATTASTVAAMAGSRAQRRWAALGATSLALVTAHVLVALWADDAPGSTYRSLLGAPRAVAWKLRTLGGIARRPTDVQWQRTARNMEGA
jgi:hypothetical protein